MCRLGGILLSNRPRTTKRYQEITEDLLGLLINMEEALGGDGNSLTFHYPDGNMRIIKEHRKVNRLFHRYNEIEQNLIDGAIIVQMHARLSTCETSEKHENMHPFTHGSITGCHNGSIHDDLIWRDMEKFNVFPYSTTDSEAIFANMSVYNPTLRPKQMQDVIDDLDGEYAITAVSQKVPNMLFMLSGSNPLCYYKDQKKGEFWYASTPDLFPDTLKEIMRTRKEKRSNKSKNKKQKQKPIIVKVPDIIRLQEGDAVYIRSNRKNISLEKTYFDVWSPLYSYGSLYRHGYGSLYSTTQTRLSKNSETN